jgi:hypothetical protein
MSGIVPNSVLIIPALFLAKAISSGIRSRQFVGDLDPIARRLWQAAPEYSRLKENDPIAAERFIQNLADEIRSNQTVVARGGSGEQGDRTAPRQLDPISTRVPSKHPLGFVELVLDFLILGYMAFRFPGPAIPALMAAGIAQFHFGIPPLPSLKDPITLLTTGERSRKSLFWAIAGGAIGYAGLAALGIGVPAPDADLGWRIFGGLVFGAAAGVFVGLAVSSVPLSYHAFRSGV